MIGIFPLTIKNGAPELAENLGKHILLLGRELVPAEALPTFFHLTARDTLFDVSIELVVGRLALLLDPVLVGVLDFGLLPELPLLLFLVSGRADHGCATFGVEIGNVKV